jgi:hypothetical protein
LIKIAGCLSLGLRSKLQKKPSALKKEHPPFKHVSQFFSVLIFLSVIFILLDLDPADQNQCGSATLYDRLPGSADTGGKTSRDRRLGVCVCEFRTSDNTINFKKEIKCTDLTFGKNHMGDLKR